MVFRLSASEVRTFWLSGSSARSFSSIGVACPRLSLGVCKLIESPENPPQIIVGFGADLAVFWRPCGIVDQGLSSHNASTAGVDRIVRSPVIQEESAQDAP